MLDWWEVIEYRILKPDDLPAAWVTLVRIAAEVDGSFDVGPTSDRDLIETMTVYVDGPDEIEAADVLATRLTDVGVAWQAR